MTVRLLHEQLSAAACGRPAAAAVVDCDRILSYGELEKRSNQLAHTLVDHGVRPGARVGLFLDKSAESIVAIYGVLKAGAVYVPLDVAAPPSRLGYIASDAGISCMLTSRRRLGELSHLVAAGAELTTVVALDQADPDAPGHLPGVRVVGWDEVQAQVSVGPDVARISQDLAYLLYTSGSTGRPKGVMLTHRNGLAFIDWAVGAIALTSSDRLSSHAPLHFDLSIFDLFAASRAGACVVLVPPETSHFPVQVARFMADQAISIWYSVPSILTMLTLRGGLVPGDLPSLRTVLFAGEVFPAKFLRQLMSLLPQAEFWNLYGPTETNVCTAYRVPQLPEGVSSPIPIGSAVSDDETFVLDENGELARRGEVGVLHVRGASVMAGYWNDQARTEEVLRPSQVHSPLQDLAYRTGDLVCELPDGGYEFLGRIDTQVKSRGYRIELGEIEMALHAHPDVMEAAVVAMADEVVGSRLYAFAAVRRDITSRELRDFCADRLPLYMLPERVDIIDVLPRTSTGKVDRQTLERASAAMSPQSPGDAR